MRYGRQKVTSKAGAQHADVHAALQYGRYPGPPVSRPGFRKQRRADRPFTADPQRRQKSEDEQVPPGLGEERESGEHRVSQDRQAQRTGAAEPIANAAEKSAAQGPAQEERPLNDRAVASYFRVGGRQTAQQFGDEWGRHQRIEV